MSEAALGDTVRVHYKGTLEDGSEFDSSEGQDPLEITLGAGLVIPGFEQAQIGMTSGQSKTVTLAADSAYGQYQNELVQEVERSQIPPEVPLEVGGALHAADADGEAVRVTIKALTDTIVTMDLNHPLAGKDLTFELQMVEIVPGSA